MPFLLSLLFNPSFYLLFWVIFTKGDASNPVVKVLILLRHTAYLFPFELLSCFLFSNLPDLESEKL